MGCALCIHSKSPREHDLVVFQQLVVQVPVEVEIVLELRKSNGFNDVNEVQEQSDNKEGFQHEYEHG
jgi:hypothetical protein